MKEVSPRKAKPKPLPEENESRSLEMICRGNQSVKTARFLSEGDFYGNTS